MSITTTCEFRKPGKEEETIGNEMRQQMMLQLHEQYAINNNSKSGTLIALISAFIISATGYGCSISLYLEKDIFSKLALVACITFIVILVFLYTVSVYLGSDQRMEQFITHKIREVYAKGLNEVLPGYYTPFGKSFFDFVQGLYNLLSGLFLFFILATATSFAYIIECDKMVTIVLAFAILSISFCIGYKIFRYVKYLKRCSNAKTIPPML